MITNLVDNDGDMFFEGLGVLENALDMSQNNGITSQMFASEK